MLFRSPETAELEGTVRTLNPEDRDMTEQHLRRMTEHIAAAHGSENKDHGIRSHHFMGNRWRNSGNSERLDLVGSKITEDGDYSHEIKRRLLLGRKVMTNLDSIFKSRDIPLPTKVV